MAKHNSKCPRCGGRTVFERTICIHMCKCGFMGYINAPANVRLS